MKTIVLATLLAATQAQAAETSLTAGAAVRNIVATPDGADKILLDITLEGAGRLASAGRTIHFHLQCKVIDTMVAKRIVEGVGDCTMTALHGGSAQVHFQTLPGIGDRGHLSFASGTGEFAGIDLRVPIAVRVNPNNMAKQVFFVENE